ncbi:TatD family hydrolase [Pseudoblastomonas halimionae]|uniref:YchF/TatD family DNA exonuclease n=1 Tax=Alteriqipengyuania halimionae TaxID=1926630 RepID=A0A6I4U0J1_9SPHN|nr:TatD family hydrolase [Alteriqipengyuania halimionae]MXP09490.1 YchF/TatD family DNA exonuclease [Alteriqipengyuania halimionae]
MLVDSHCHLNYEGLVEDQDSVLDRARSAGIGKFLNISTRESEWDDIVATAERNEDVFASIGIHPHHADEHQHVDEDRLREAVDHPKVIGIGETGLDYYYEHSDREAQQRLFRRHITVCRETRLPLIIHTRDAEDDTLSILRDEMEKGDFPALIHCFTASDAFGEAVLDLGLTISISGIVTFKNAKELQATAAKVPEDRLLVETDSPFLAPVPHRGKTCEPAYVADTARFVAELRSTTPEQLAEVTTRNFFGLFTKAAA